MKHFSIDFNFLHKLPFDQADRLPGGGVGVAIINQWRADADGGDGEVAQPPYYAASQTSFPDLEMCSGAFTLTSLMFCANIKRYQSISCLHIKLLL